MSEDKREIDGDAIREKRRDKEMSQYDLAKEAGVTPLTVLYLEGGARKDCLVSTLAGLAHALGATLDELMTSVE